MTTNFNTCQDSQFTSDAFTGSLWDCCATISVDGRERALDKIFIERPWQSVKHEDFAFVMVSQVNKDFIFAKERKRPVLRKKWTSS